MYLLVTERHVLTLQAQAATPTFLAAPWAVSDVRPLFVGSLPAILTPRVNRGFIFAHKARSHFHACLTAAIVTEFSDPTLLLARDANPLWRLHSQDLHKTNSWIRCRLWLNWDSPPWCLIQNRCVLAMRAGTPKHTSAVEFWAPAHWGHV